MKRTRRLVVVRGRDDDAGMWIWEVSVDGVVTANGKAPLKTQALADGRQSMHLQRVAALLDRAALRRCTCGHDIMRHGAYGCYDCPCKDWVRES